MALNFEIGEKCKAKIVALYLEGPKSGSKLTQNDAT